MPTDNELKKGSIQTLILAVLADGPRHGYAIAREIERRSVDALSFGEGALYPALRALEREESGRQPVGTAAERPGPAHLHAHGRRAGEARRPGRRLASLFGLPWTGFWGEWEATPDVQPV